MGASSSKQQQLSPTQQRIQRFEDEKVESRAAQFLLANHDNDLRQNVPNPPTLPLLIRWLKLPSVATLSKDQFEEQFLLRSAALPWNFSDRESGETVLTAMIENKTILSEDKLEFILLHSTTLIKEFKHEPNNINRRIDSPLSLAFKNQIAPELISFLIKKGAYAITFDKLLNTPLITFIQTWSSPPAWLLAQLLSKAQEEIDFMLDAKRKHTWISINTKPNITSITQSHIEPESLASYVCFTTLHNNSAVTVALSTGKSAQIIQLLLRHIDPMIIENIDTGDTNYIPPDSMSATKTTKSTFSPLSPNALGFAISIPNNEDVVLYLLSRGLSRAKPLVPKFYNQYRFYNLYFAELQLPTFPNHLSLVSSLFLHYNPFVKLFFRLGLTTAFTNADLLLIQTMLCESQRLQKLFTLVQYLPNPSIQELVFKTITDGMVHYFRFFNDINNMIPRVNFFLQYYSKLALKKGLGPQYTSLFPALSVNITDFPLNAPLERLGLHQIHYNLQQSSPEWWSTLPEFESLLSPQQLLMEFRDIMINPIELGLNEHRLELTAKHEFYATNPEDEGKMIDKRTMLSNLQTDGIMTYLNNNGNGTNLTTNIPIGTITPHAPTIAAYNAIQQNTVQQGGWTKGFHVKRINQAIVDAKLQEIEDEEEKLKSFTMDRFQKQCASVYEDYIETNLLTLETPTNYFTQNILKNGQLHDQFDSNGQMNDGEEQKSTTTTTIGKIITSDGRILDKSQLFSGQQLDSGVISLRPCPSLPPKGDADNDDKIQQELYNLFHTKIQTNNGDTSSNDYVPFPYALLIENILQSYYSMWRSWTFYFIHSPFGSSLTDLEIKRSKLWVEIVSNEMQYESFLLKYYPQTYHETITEIFNPDTMDLDITNMNDDNTISNEQLTREERILQCIPKGDGEIGIASKMYEFFYNLNPIFKAQVLPYKALNGAPLISLNLLDYISIMTSGIIFRQPTEMISPPTSEQYYSYLSILLEERLTLIEQSESDMNDNDNNNNVKKLKPYLNPTQIQQPGETLNFTKTLVPGLLWWCLYYSNPNLDDVMNLISSTRTDILNDQRQSTLMIAIARTWPEAALTALARKCININLQDCMGRTALHYYFMCGCFRSCPNFYSILIKDFGAILNIVDTFGHTPLTYAIYNHAPNHILCHLIDLTLTRYPKQVETYYQYYEPTTIDAYTQELIEPLPYISTRKIVPAIQYGPQIDQYIPTLSIEDIASSSTPLTNSGLYKQLLTHPTNNKVRGLDINEFKLTFNSFSFNQQEKLRSNLDDDKLLFNTPFAINYLTNASFANDYTLKLVVIPAGSNKSYYEQSNNFRDQVETTAPPQTIRTPIDIRSTLTTIFGIMLRCHTDIAVISHLFSRIGFAYLACKLHDDNNHPLRLQQLQQEQFNIINYLQTNTQLFTLFENIFDHLISTCNPAQELSTERGAISFLGLGAMCTNSANLQDAECTKIPSVYRIPLHNVPTTRHGKSMAGTITHTTFFSIFRSTYQKDMLDYGSTFAYEKLYTKWYQWLAIK